MMLDAVIIGGGPIGLACGIACQQRNLSYVILEKGCLVNSLFNYPLTMTFFSTADRLEIGGVPFTCVHSKPNRAEALEYYRRVADWYDLNLHLFEKAEEVHKNESGVFVVKTAKADYTASNLVLATGFYDIPVALNVPGEELPKVTHYYKDPHYYSFQKVIVVGGNNSAVDAALECWRKGAEVTMVMMEPEVGQRVKYWARPDIVNRIAEGSIKAYTNSKITAIRAEEVEIQTPVGVVCIPNDFVIAATGYKPQVELLRQLGIMLEDEITCKPVYDTENMQTNVPGLYLAGVVCGGLETHRWFIENSRVHADKIADHIRAGIDSFSSSPS